ncbi:MAG: sirohydrochlorin cobaltochelatase [Roseburia sp.]|nr:sirohydrochlorin cobaltochelatase [Roseburia sp.]MCM1421166.1 sirohydrochlorin cobaltochelatase [Bacteroides sp.]
MKEGDKAAVVAVHFGTSHIDTRKNTIDKFNERLRREFPECDFREAWTSRIIVRKMAQQGEKISIPSELFTELKREGYTHILVQSSNIIEGTEMENLRSEIDAARKDFKAIRLGDPLLSSPEDYEKAILTVAAFYGNEKTANILVCHGSKGNRNSSYTMLDYVLRDKEYSNWFVGTIEGYPSFDNLVKNMKKSKAKKANLIPFMFVAGDHAKNDIAVEWKEELQKTGLKVDVTLHSLGELDGILDIFMNHAREAKTYRTYSPKERKMQMRTL